MKLFNLFNWVKNLVEAFTFYGSSGGGGGPQTSTSYSTNLPEYAQPFYQELMKQTGKNVYTTDTAGNVTGVKPLPTYTGDRIAGFTPGQTAIQQEVSRLQMPGGFGQAASGLAGAQGLSQFAGAAGLSKALNYTPTNVSAQNISAPNLMNYQMTGPSSVNAPSLQQYGMGAAQLAYNPNLTTYQMGPAQNVSAMGIGTQNFGQGAADYYMSPYAQAAINPALREARLQGD